MLPLLRPARLRERARRGASVALAGALASGVVHGVAGPSEAEEAPRADQRLTLTWHAPAGCPSAEQVRADVSGLLAHTPVPSGDALAVQAVIVELPEGAFALTLETGGQQRRIESPSCERLAQAAAVVIALLLDPGLGGAAASVAPEAPAVGPEPPPPPVPEPPPPVPEPPRSPPRPTDSPQLPVVLGLRTDLAAWPHPAPSLLGGVAWAGQRTQIALEVGVLARQRLDAGGGAQLDLWPVQIELVPAVRRAFHGWAVDLGAGPEVTVIGAHATGLEPERRPTAAFGLRAAGHVTRALGAHLGLRVGVGGGVPLAWPRWVVAEQGQIAALGPGLRGEVGLVIR